MNEDVKAALDEAQSLGFKLAGQRDAAWIKIEKLERELAEFRRRDEPMRRGLDAVVNLERGTLRFENGWLVEMNTLGYDFGYDQAPIDDSKERRTDTMKPGTRFPLYCAARDGDDIAIFIQTREKLPAGGSRKIAEEKTIVRFAATAGGERAANDYMLRKNAETVTRFRA